ncbi:unnamed protein product [Miscanthus lutarioriparius]|uniref:Uncharacterized protein n=1 Tax=Miscanthus lutarioriparius TaxID=422564 RepID=A0A811Q7E2_9POAL|nr:unnamed protein product [Miscanthus lutarioriparius]
MHRLAGAMLVLLWCCCCLFLATHAHQQQQLQPAAGGNRASPSCIPHERDALLAFKHGVTSDPAGLLDSWRWSDLTGPSGHLPEFLGSLKSLTYLNLSGIPFSSSGGVPPQLGNLSKLQYLDLSSTYMFGTNSTNLSWLARLTSIQYVNLNQMNLCTVVDWPHVMNMLPSLRVLHLSTCSLANANQSLPHLNLTNLEELDASWNSLNHPMVSSWFWNITSLKRLNLDSTGMFGQFPDALGDMTSLQVLDLSGNYYYDDDAKNMRVMTAGWNNITGSLPTSVGQFAGLQTLDLSHNNLNGNVPYEIGVLSNLTHLGLNSNKLDGVVTEEHLVSARSLKYIDLSYNALKIEISSDRQPPFRLDTAYFASCQMGPLFPSWLKWHVNIINLDISSADMFVLDLSRNKLSGELPMWIGKLTSLIILRLSHNKFCGNVPVNITNLACLQYMDLNNNKISGSLPIYLSNLNLKTTRKTSMTDGCYPIIMYDPPLILNDPLDLSSFSTVLKGQELNYGSINGVLDTSMMSIDLSSNNLTGEISEEIVFLDGLVNLNLSRNHLSGVVPSKIGEMQSLESLDLSRNKLSGEIPVSRSNLTFLSYLDLSYNNLTGRIPSGPQLDTLYAEQGGLGRTEEGHGIQFFYLGLRCGFIVVTWVAFGVLLFKRSWRITCFRLSDKLYGKVYVLVALWARSRETGTDRHA